VLFFNDPFPDPASWQRNKTEKCLLPLTSAALTLAAWDLFQEHHEDESVFSQNGTESLKTGNSGSLREADGGLGEHFFPGLGLTPS
jgi:hypothetical protein